MTKKPFSKKKTSLETLSSVSKCIQEAHRHFEQHRYGEALALYQGLWKNTAVTHSNEATTVRERLLACYLACAKERATHKDFKTACALYEARQLLEPPIVTEDVYDYLQWLLACHELKKVLAKLTQHQQLLGTSKRYDPFCCLLLCHCLLHDKMEALALPEERWQRERHSVGCC